MKKLATALLALLLGGVVSYSAEPYYEVNQAPDPRLKNYRQGEVIVKFKPESAVNLRANAQGRFHSAGTGAVDNALRGIGVTEFEPLMPLTGKLSPSTPRTVRSHNGTTIEIKDMSKLYRLRVSGTNVE